MLSDPSDKKCQAEILASSDGIERTKRLMRGMRIGSLDMFRAEADSDDPCRDAAQGRNSSKNPQQARRFEWIRTSQHAPDYSVLHGDLKSLRGARRKLATLLHCAQVLLGDGSLLQARSQNIGGGDGVLDREVDPDAADRRHRMRGIADA